MKIAFEKRAIIALLTLLLVRVAGMIFIPLNETTEARYGEMARKMLETGNWVTLWHDYGIPFLAKPPLYAWLSAASMGLLGVNEFAVRLPSLLLSVGMLALVGYVAFVRHGKEVALAAVLILASCLGFFVAGGTVMTDPSLVFCVTLILVSFWLAMQDKRLWSWLFFAGCGLGLLAKGPVALVLAGLPVFFWVLIRKEWLALWQKLPWVRGCGIVLAIALPWYLLAEHRTPGFLQYFIVGENISRFLDPHWKGDRYGFAHAYPYGMIWVFIFAGLFPWGLVALQWCRTRLTDKEGWLLFLVLWSASSPVFFTFAANIIWPYCLIMQPGFALLLAELCARTGRPYKKYVPLTALVTALAGAVAIVLFVVYPHKFAQDQKDVIAAWKETSPAADSSLVFWSNRMEFSAAFYSGGRARATDKPEALDKLLHNGIRDCLIAYDYNETELPQKVRNSFKEVGRFTNARGVRILYCEP
jgi:4-amino-4-deoxy-L-arabinose transferase-like glycosyltransferase